MKSILKTILVLLLAVLASCTKATPECTLEFLYMDTEIYIGKGEIYPIQYSAYHSGCHGESPVWTSSDNSVAIYEDEVIKGVAPGKAVITCSHASKDYVFNVCVTGLDKSEFTLKKGQFVTLTALPQMSGEIDWVSSDSSIASVDKQGVVTAKDCGTAIISASGKEYTYGSCVVTVPHTSSCPKEAVDLGLSAYWATCNLGASSPEEEGGYYAWGEVKPKTYFSWSGYAYGGGAGSVSSSRFTKYNTSSKYGTVDNKTVLEKSDDAAYSALGGSWRMPTSKDLDQLINNCEWSLATINGNTVYKVTSKLPGYKGNYILIPNSGYCGSGRKDGYLFWSSSLDQEEPSEANYLRINEYSHGLDLWNSTCLRYFGLHVRPVSD